MGYRQTSFRGGPIVNPHDVKMVIEALLMAGLMALLGWGASHGRPQVDRANGSLLFQYGRSARFAAYLLAIGASVLFGLIVFTVPIKNQSDVLAILAIAGIFLGPVAILLWEFTRHSLTATPEGLDFRSAWRRPIFVAWQDIEDVSFSMLCHWFVVRSSHGQTIHLSKWIAGISDLLGVLERKLDASVLEHARRGYLIVGRPFPGGNQGR
jgi:hypothetical protein